TPRQLPHLDKIQQSFGQYLSHVQAYMGKEAAAASQKLGAAAYTSGNQERLGWDVVRDGSYPNEPNETDN
ncbi:MAG: DUF4157 domain-containing protein, partial [Ekhidna sp.]